MVDRTHAMEIRQSIARLPSKKPHIVDRRVDGCYFKAGVYVQSNLRKGDLPGEYGEVVIQTLRISHAE